MTTVAPCFANATEMARPMPREPPVTSTTLSLNALISSSQGREDLLQARGVFHVERLDVLGDALGESAEHLARAQLDEARDALGLECFHALDPPHHGADLLEEERHHPRPLTLGAASPLGRASTFVTTGTAGAFTFTWASTSPRRGLTGSISEQWKGADTGRGMTRLAPSSLHRAPARSTAWAWPAMTVCSGEL